MKKTYQMEELDCAHCAAKMELAIRAIDGVTAASINIFAQRVKVEFADCADETKIMKEALKACRKDEPDCSILL